MKDKTEIVICESSGYELLCRLVPPDAFLDVYRAEPEPKLPRVQIESVAGGAEEKYPLPGTEEWTEWQEAQRMWRRKLKELTQDFATNFGIVGWRKIGSDASFSDDVPKEWKLPAIMLEYGVKDKKGVERRLQFIRYELILTDVDADAVHAVITGKNQMKPLSKEEVNAAMTPFPSETTEEGR